MSNLLFICQYPALVTGIAGAVLVSGISNKKRFFGFLIWILSDILWGLFAIDTGAWGFLLMQVFFICTCIKGMLNNRKSTNV